MEQGKLRRGLIVDEDTKDYTPGAPSELVRKTQITNEKAAQVYPLPQFVDFMRQRLSEGKLSKQEEEQILPTAEMLRKMTGDADIKFMDALKMAMPEPEAQPEKKPTLNWKYKNTP